MKKTIYRQALDAPRLRRAHLHQAADAQHAARAQLFELGVPGTVNNTNCVFDLSFTPGADKMVGNACPR